MTLRFAIVTGRGRSTALRPVLLLAVAAAMGCGDGKRSKPEPADEGPPAPRAVTGLDAVPASARAVVGLNIPKLRDSALVRRGVRWVLDSDPGLRARIDTLLSSCGIDPAIDLTSLAIATGSRPSEALMVVTGTLVEETLVACVRSAMTSGGGDLVEHEVGDRRAYETTNPSGATAVWFAFGANKTVVAATSREWLAAGLSDGPKLSEARWAAPLVVRAGPESGIWAVGQVEPRVGQGLGQVTGGAAKAPSHMFAHVDVNDGVEAELGAVMTSEADAAAVARFGTSQLRPITMLAQGYGLGGAVGKLRVEAETSTVFLRLQLNEDDVKEVIWQIDRAAGRE